MTRLPVLLGAVIALMLLTASGMMIAHSLPTVPDEIEVHHRITVEIPSRLEVDASVDVDPGQLNFGRVRVDLPPGVKP